MKKALLFLVMLAVLGGAGYAVYIHFFTDGELLAPRALSFPKQVKGLHQTGTITTHPFGLYEITAADMHDLLLLQGHLHGSHAGPELDQLVALFKGVPGRTGVKALDDLAPVFYYLDLTTTAKACVQQLPPHVSVLLTAYAEGLSAGAGNRRWTLTDLFVYQRGLAFLINRCWSKERALRWWVARLGRTADLFPRDLPPIHPPVDPALEDDAALAGLFRPPWFETTLLRDDAGVWAQHLRGDPFFQFLAVPIRFEIPEQHLIEGLSLAGLPFLWSGRNAHIQFALQPRLTRDETFYVFSEDQFVGQAHLFQEADTGNIAKLYEQPPLSAPFGRWVKPLLFGPENIDIYYDWDGFRPSAELVTLYYLFIAADLDDARSAMQYHQVPSVALMLGGDSPRRFTRLYASSNPGRDRSAASFQPPLFRRAWERALPVGAVRGSADDWATWGNGDLTKNNGFRAVSPHDQALVDALLFRLDGALQTELSEKQLTDIRALLTQPSGSDRALFLAEVWRRLMRNVAEAAVEDGAGWWQPMVALPLQRLILADLGSRQGDLRMKIGGIEGLNKMTATALKQALARTRDTAAPLVLAADGLAMKTVGTVAESSSPTGVFRQAGGRVAQVGWLTMVWHEPLLFWHYPIRDGHGQVGSPKRVTFSPAKATPFAIRPGR